MACRKTYIPVALPPGRLKLATMPILTGSSPHKKTIGIVVVAIFAARAELMPPVAAITSTRRSTNSAASAGKRDATRHVRFLHHVQEHKKSLPIALAHSH